MFVFFRANTEQPKSKLEDELTKKCKQTVDLRICQFCGQHGGHGEAGRLLHVRLRDWVHVNCALWSSEVYEEVDGSLQNVGQALSRGSKLLCTVCGKRGATIGCCHEFCVENYHFACGRVNAIFKEDKTVYCR